MGICVRSSAKMCAKVRMWKICENLAHSHICTRASAEKLCGVPAGTALKGPSTVAHLAGAEKCVHWVHPLWGGAFKGLTTHPLHGTTRKLLWVAFQALKSRMTCFWKSNWKQPLFIGQNFRIQLCVIQTDYRKVARSILTSFGQRLQYISINFSFINSLKILECVTNQDSLLLATL